MQTNQRFIKVGPQCIVLLTYCHDICYLVHILISNERVFPPIKMHCSIIPCDPHMMTHIPLRIRIVYVYTSYIFTVVSYNSSHTVRTTDLNHLRKDLLFLRTKCAPFKARTHTHTLLGAITFKFKLKSNPLRQELKLKTVKVRNYTREKTNF